MPARRTSFHEAMPLGCWHLPGYGAFLHRTWPHLLNLELEARLGLGLGLGDEGLAVEGLEFGESFGSPTNPKPRTLSLNLIVPINPNP